MGEGSGFLPNLLPHLGERREREQAVENDFFNRLLDIGGRAGSVADDVVSCELLSASISLISRGSGNQSSLILIGSANSASSVSAIGFNFWPWCDHLRYGASRGSNASAPSIGARPAPKHHERCTLRTA